MCLLPRIFEIMTSCVYRRNTDSIYQMTEVALKHKVRRNPLGSFNHRSKYGNLGRCLGCKAPVTQAGGTKF